MFIVFIYLLFIFGNKGILPILSFPKNSGSLNIQENSKLNCNHNKCFEFYNFTLNA